MALQGGKQRMRGKARLHPQLAGAADGGIAPGPAAGLQQQAEQPLRRTEITAEQGSIRVERRHQRDAAEIMALGNHLRAHQHIHIAAVHARQLLLQAAGVARGVGIDACNHQRLAIGTREGAQFMRQGFFQLLGALAQRLHIQIAAGRAGAWHAFGKAAVVAAQGTVDLVEHAVGTAVRTFAFPAAIGAMQHGSVAAPVQQHHALFPACGPLGHGLQQLGAEHATAVLVVHVDQSYARQWRSADAGRHGQTQIAAAGIAIPGWPALVPALQRRGGRAQQDAGLRMVRAVDGQIPCRIAGAFLLLVAGVVLFVHHDQAQARQRRQHGHACAQHDARLSGMRRQPAL